MYLPRFIVKYVRNPIRKGAEYLDFSEHTYLILLSLVTGVICGFGAVGVRFLIETIQRVAIGSGGEDVLATLAALPWYWLVILPAAGGAIIGPLVHFFAREAKGHGVPEVMEAVALHGGRIRPRVALVKSAASALCIGTGGSTGIEGPIVQIGSSIGSTVGQILRLKADRIRILVACGAAAGIAATFNAPMAGVLFAIEIILGSYAISTLTPLIISSVAGCVVSYSFPAVTGGDVKMFDLSQQFQLVSPVELPMYFGLGLASAAVALVFVRTLYAVEDGFGAIPIPDWIKAAVGGAVLGGIMAAMVPLVGKPYIFGSGYRAMEQAMGSGLSFEVLVALIALKIAGTSFTLGSGGSGGIFAPSLFIGAMTGGAFGSGVHTLLPSHTAQPGAYALVGMGAVVAGATHAPMTSIMIIFEMTGDYSVILPIMISCVTASLVASRLKRDSIYTEKLSRRGVNLNQGLETTIIGASTVSDVMESDAPTVMETETLNHVLERFLDLHAIQVYILDAAGALKGIIHINDVITTISESELHKGFIAADVMELTFPTLEIDEPLTGAFRKFGTCHLEEIPVVERTPQGSRFAGVVTRRALFLYYNREVLRQSALGLKYVHREEEGPVNDFIWMPADHEVKVMPVTRSMAGKTLKELDIRARFGINVVAIRSGRYSNTRDSDVPSPDRVLNSHETLVLVGSHEDIRRMLKENG